MFTGIIEAIGTVEKIAQEGTNKSFLVASRISDELKVDQSVSHDGVCLTVVKREPGMHWVTAVKETMQASNLDHINVGSRMNLERCMLNNGRFDGHIVQGHVDQTGTVKSIHDEGGSWLFRFEYAGDKQNITVEKGSISVNGVSLTCFQSTPGAFSVAIIPYTFQNTTFQDLRPGATVNLEFDIIGKYVRRLLATS
jgi:riboflavin synthase